MHARSLKGLSDADIAALQRLVDDQVEENLGMAMIYTIIAAAQEWLRDKARLVSAPACMTGVSTYNGLTVYCSDLGCSHSDYQLVAPGIANSPPQPGVVTALVRCTLFIALCA